MQITLNVNDKDVQIDVQPMEVLLDVLREKLHLHSVKRGCGAGDCGACTVLIDGEPVTSCIYLAVRAQGKKIFTTEGLGTPDHPHPLQNQFQKHGSFQCGFCAPGMLMTSKALLDKNPTPSEEEIRRSIYGNICRCSGYMKIIEAIAATVEENRKGGCEDGQA